MILRERFDKYKNETNQKRIDKILQDAEIEFESKKHPFPYTGKYIKACFFSCVLCELA